ncbi:bacterioferritin-associated ferredoxin [Xanthomonas sp. Kuri4-1]
MYVCICNGVTDHQIREAAAHGCSSVAELTMRTGCGSNCGSCLDMAADLLAQARVREFPLPLIGLASAA